jgi:hypothetical protein
VRKLCFHPLPLYNLLLVAPIREKREMDLIINAKEQVEVVNILLWKHMRRDASKLGHINDSLGCKIKIERHISIIGN